MKCVLSLALCFIMTGCVAVWGKSFSVIETTPDKIVIEYDPALAIAFDLDKTANSHCNSVGKLAERVDDIHDYLGIYQTTYNCNAK